MAERIAFRVLPLALVLLAATACADNDTGPAATPAPDATESAAQELPVTPPPIANEPPPRRMPGSDETLGSCDADAARDAVGKVDTAEVMEQARVAAGASTARTLKPGQVVTLEYHGSRLNLHVDEANVVVDLGCG